MWVLARWSRETDRSDRKVPMKIRTPVVVASVGIGVIRALRRWRAPGQTTKDRLHYRVPVGQDAAAVLGRLRTEGFSADAELVAGDDEIVIDCDGAESRERIREVLRDAPVDASGAPFDGPPVRFTDE